MDINLTTKNIFFLDTGIWKNVLKPNHIRGEKFRNSFNDIFKSDLENINLPFSYLLFLEVISLGNFYEKFKKEQIKSSLSSLNQSEINENSINDVYAIFKNALKSSHFFEQGSLIKQLKKESCFRDKFTRNHLFDKYNQYLSTDGISSLYFKIISEIIQEIDFDNKDRSEKYHIFLTKELIQFYLHAPEKNIPFFRVLAKIYNLNFPDENAELSRSGAELVDSEIIHFLLLGYTSKGSSRPSPVICLSTERKDNWAGKVKLLHTLIKFTNDCLIPKLWPDLSKITIHPGKIYHVNPADGVIDPEPIVIENILLK